MAEKSDFKVGDRVRVVRDPDKDERFLGATGVVVPDPTGWLNAEVGWVEIRLDDEALRSLAKAETSGDTIIYTPDEIEKI